MPPLWDGYDVGKQAVLKIVTNPDLLTVVKISARRKISDGGLENPDSHGRLLRRSLASSQSTCCSSPVAKRASVSRSAASCHLGESNSSSTRLRSIQRASINLSFSGRGNPIACSSTLIGLQYHQFPPDSSVRIPIPGWLRRQEFWVLQRTLEVSHRPAAGGAVGSTDWLGEFVFYSV